MLPIVNSQFPLTLGKTLKNNKKQYKMCERDCIMNTFTKNGQPMQCYHCIKTMILY